MKSCLKGNRVRIVYYVWWATAEENQNGTHHKSEPFVLPAQAQAKANEMWKTQDHVSIDQVYEKQKSGEWEALETEAIEIV